MRLYQCSLHRANVLAIENWLFLQNNLSAASFNCAPTYYIVFGGGGGSFEAAKPSNGVNGQKKYIVLEFKLLCFKSPKQEPIVLEPITFAISIYGRQCKSLVILLLCYGRKRILNVLTATFLSKHIPSKALDVYFTSIALKYCTDDISCNLATKL